MAGSFYKTRQSTRKNVPGRIYVAIVARTARPAGPLSYSKIADTFRPFVRQCAAL